MKTEKHTLSCPRYKGALTVITDFYDNQGNWHHSTCSLMNSSSRFRCDGMEDGINECPYVSE